MEKQSLSHYQEYSEKSFTKRVVYKRDESVVFILNFMPGQELPKHKHPGTQVYLHVLEGNGTMTIDGHDNEIEQGDIIRVDGNEEFSFNNSGQHRLSLHVVLNKIPDERYAQNV